MSRTGRRSRTRLCAAAIIRNGAASSASGSGRRCRSIPARSASPMQAPILDEIPLEALAGIEHDIPRPTSVIERGIGAVASVLGGSLVLIEVLVLGWGVFA